jgi:hypothetical protein
MDDLLARMTAGPAAGNADLLSLVTLLAILYARPSGAAAVRRRQPAVFGEFSSDGCRQLLFYASSISRRSAIPLESHTRMSTGLVAGSLADSHAASQIILRIVDVNGWQEGKAFFLSVYLYSNLNSCDKYFLS